MTYEIIDATLREDPTVFDCAVLPRESSSGRADAVAYVVPTGSLSLSRLRQSLIDRLGADAAIPTSGALRVYYLVPRGDWRQIMPYRTAIAMPPSKTKPGLVS